MASPFENLGVTDLPVDDCHFELPSTTVNVDEESEGYRELVDSLEKEPASWKPLCEAIRCNDEDTVRQESLHLEGPSTHVAKTAAVLVGRPDILKLLLERDSSIDEFTVAAACAKRDRASVRMLLGFGWPANKPIRLTASMLCEAVDDMEFTKWLIEAGADVNARSTVDESALSVAIARGSMDVVWLLLAQGTDITHGDLLHHAAERKNQFEGAEIVEELVKRGAEVNAYRYNNPPAFKWKGLSMLRTPLYIACSEKNIPVARALLRHGANPICKVPNAGPAPQTPLDRAIETNEEELIDLLRTYSVRKRASL